DETIGCDQRPQAIGSVGECSVASSRLQGRPDRLQHLSRLFYRCQTLWSERLANSSDAAKRLPERLALSSEVTDTIVAGAVDDVLEARIELGEFAFYRQPERASAGEHRQEGFALLRRQLLESPGNSAFLDLD